MVQRYLKNLQRGAVLLILALTVFSTAQAQLLDRVVANVNGTPILESELKVASIFYGIKNREELIDKLIEKHLIAQFLMEKGLSIPEDYIEKLVKDIAASNGKSIEEFYRELYSEGLTPDDLKGFLKIEVASTLGLNEYLRMKVEVSDLEIELEKLRKGEVEFIKEVELLVISKDRGREASELLGTKGIDLKEIGNALGVKLERLKVRRGELVPPLDREVWKAGDGEVVVAEDEKNLYLAKVIRTVRVYSGRTEEEIKEQILRKKLEEEKARIVKKLRKEGFVEILS